MNSIGKLIKFERIKQNMSQKSLCHGICSNTYLSKIELSQISTSEEILALLVDALGYKYNEGNIEQFKELNDTVWDLYFNNFHVDYDFNEQERLMLDDLYLSSVSVEVLLLRALVDLLNQRDIDQSYFDIIDEKLLESSHLYKHLIILCLNNKENVFTNLSLINYQDDRGYITYYKASASFIKGNYFDSLKYSKLAYAMFSDQGKINWMISSSFYEGGSYSNLNNFESFVKVNKRIISLNSSHYYVDKDINNMLDYNLGATYLMMKDYDLAIEHLLKSFNEDSYYRNLNLEKLSFAYLFKSDFIGAKDHIDKLEGDVSYDVIKYLLDSQNNIRSKDYVNLLESTYNKIVEEHHGRSILYKQLLMEAYKVNYMYPRALKLYEDDNKQENQSYFK